MHDSLYLILKRGYTDKELELNIYNQLSKLLENENLHKDDYFLLLYSRILIGLRCLSDEFIMPQMEKSAKIMGLFDSSSEKSLGVKMSDDSISRQINEKIVLELHSERFKESSFSDKRLDELFDDLKNPEIKEYVRLHKIRVIEALIQYCSKEKIIAKIPKLNISETKDIYENLLAVNFLTQVSKILKKRFPPYAIPLQELEIENLEGYTYESEEAKIKLNTALFR